MSQGYEPYDTLGVCPVLFNLNNSCERHVKWFMTAIKHTTRNRLTLLRSSSSLDKRGRRGVSPVISTILLILIAVASGFIMWIWVSGYLTGSPTKQPTFEMIKIEAVQIQQDLMRVYVRNMGSASVSVGSTYIVDVNGNYVGGGPLPSVKEIEAGGVTVVEVRVTDVDLVPNNVYVVKVITTRGTETSYTFIAP